MKNNIYEEKESTKLFYMNLRVKMKGNEMQI